MIGPKWASVVLEGQLSIGIILTNLNKTMQKMHAHDSIKKKRTKRTSVYKFSEKWIILMKILS